MTPAPPTAGTTPPGLVLMRRDGPVAELTLNRPEALNAISSALARELAAGFHDVAGDLGVSVVVLSSSSDRAFCVGADLKERAGFTEDDLFAQRPLFREAFAALLALPVPVVAAVSGFAVGGGLELALSADIIVADDTAVLGLPEVGVGLVPGCGGTQLLARRIGAGRAADLLFTGRRVAADEAQRLGLIDRLAVTGQARSAALELAAAIAANSPTALREAKRAFRAGAHDGLSAGMEAEDAAWRTVVRSPDRREGIAAFAEKRSPVWSMDLATDAGGATPLKETT